MPRAKFEEVARRKAATSFGEKMEEQEWERRIKESLNKKVTFDFVETPLQDVVNFLSSLVDVTIVLDTTATKDAPNVTLRVNDMRLQSALNWILKLVALKYTLKDEAVFISKGENITERPVLRMYDVTDLTIDIKNFQGRQQALASDSGYSSTGSSFGGGGGGQMAQEFFGGNEDENKEEEKITGESLVEFIKKTIAPGSWDEGGVAAPGKEF
jgi:type II secretory pathway component GspD/PulD (secretin)